MTTLKISLAACLICISAVSFADATSDFATLLDEHWEWRLASSPVQASMLGDRRYNDQWADQSLGAIERRHNDTQAFLRRAYAIQRNDLSTADQLNYELFRRQLQDDVDRHQFRSYLMPFSHRGGIQTLNNLTSRLRLETVKDFDDWLARISKIDVVVNQTIALAEQGRKTGYMAPQI